MCRQHSDPKTEHAPVSDEPAADNTVIEVSAFVAHLTFNLMLFCWQGKIRGFPAGPRLRILRGFGNSRLQCIQSRRRHFRLLRHLCPRPSQRKRSCAYAQLVQRLLHRLPRLHLRQPTSLHITHFQKADVASQWYSLQKEVSRQSCFEHPRVVSSHISDSSCNADCPVLASLRSWPCKICDQWHCSWCCHFHLRISSQPHRRCNGPGEVAVCPDFGRFAVILTEFAAAIRTIVFSFGLMKCSLFSAFLDTIHSFSLVFTVRHARTLSVGWFSYVCNREVATSRQLCSPIIDVDSTEIILSAREPLLMRCLRNLSPSSPPTQLDPSFF
jgi:hypothetical protein